METQIEKGKKKAIATKAYYITKNLLVQQLNVLKNFKKWLSQ